MVVNFLQLKRQPQAGGLMGISQALHDEVMFDEGAVTSTSWMLASQALTSRRQPASLLRKQAQRKAASLGSSKPGDFFSHSGGHFVEGRLHRAAFDGKQDRSREGRKGEVGGGEAAAS